jgi:CRISPR system Cascade subunit CasA
MTNPTYDLTREPWIPCETKTGARLLLGFEDVLLRAHELLAVHDESPLVTAMLHRLLLACAHRVVDGPRSLKEWGALWRQDRFDEARVRGYFSKWRHRFDLFHPDRPFLQVGGLLEQLTHDRGGKPPSRVAIRRLAMEASTYAGAVQLLEHGGDDDLVPPGDAVRAMLGMLGFAAGGRIANTADSAPACPLRPGAVAIVIGETLRETLVLNLLVLGKDKPVPDSGTDRPAWEADRPAAYGKRPVLGWLDALTWQARRVALLGEQGLVKEAVCAGGEQTEHWIEPMHALDVRDVKVGALAVKFMPDRVGFRDAVALYQSVVPDSRPPNVCSQLAELIAEELLAERTSLRLMLLGLSSDQAAIRLSRAELMPLPGRLLVDRDRMDKLRGALQDAENVEGALRKADYRLASCALDMGDRGPDKRDVGALVQRLDDRAHYWNRLARAFPVLVSGVADGDEHARGRFSEEARAAARAALQRAADDIGEGARAHRARALAERTLEAELEKLFPTPQPEGTHA